MGKINDAILKAGRDGSIVYLYDSFEEKGARLDVKNGKYWLNNPRCGEIEVDSSNETLNELIMGGELVSKKKYESIYTPPVKDSHCMSADEFGEYIRSHNSLYVYNPICDLAFKEVGNYPDGRLYCKGRGGAEHEVDWMDEDFELAMMMRNVMTEKEYESF